ncbi:MULTISPECIES: adenosine deaminase [unclassified Lactococcus]|uniref:adenosine deaminase family protein n=1 Tax=unclassified Lactococcus TaxID=2643510 RepID=UPI0011CB41E1|nr:MULTISPECIES: adenosine deaminase [unclassified Lactococcus]MQW23250.1 adenosine deaminase [Lactococcus sp. dk101]TXK38082.1 adenosine deaminase [Lactococcus sp. dk310]TXK49761.1 adenosine deaminase [Lactococcus sp. dk322]
METKTAVELENLADLHMHISASVTPEILWDLAHEQGMKLPMRDYFEFAKSVTIDGNVGYEEYLKMYDLLEEIQSTPEAMFRLAEQVPTHLYQHDKIDLVEIRMNPMLRSRSGKIDLDHIIVYTLQGLERASLKFPRLRTGLILSMDRRFPPDVNKIIVDKAIKYKDRGVIGIDLAGPIDKNFSFEPIEGLAKRIHAEGLGLTIHTGEATNADEMWEVVTKLKPNRIGHGIACVHDENLMAYLREHRIVLETCPTSNLKTKSVKDLDEMRFNYQTLLEHRVPFTINTDGPILQKTTLPKEYEMLIENHILTMDQAQAANQLAHEVSFIK